MVQFHNHTTYNKGNKKYPKVQVHKKVTLTQDEINEDDIGVEVKRVEAIETAITKTYMDMIQTL